MYAGGRSEHDEIKFRHIDIVITYVYLISERQSDGQISGGRYKNTLFYFISEICMFRVDIFDEIYGIVDIIGIGNSVRFLSYFRDTIFRSVKWTNSKA